MIEIRKRENRFDFDAVHKILIERIQANKEQLTASGSKKTDRERERKRVRTKNDNATKRMQTLFIEKQEKRKLEATINEAAVPICLIFHHQ